MANDSYLSGPTASVPKDPQPSVDRIDDLARRILSGDILLPKFQRDFVWDRPQVLSLLDSVYKNYPVGSVLLWQSRQELRSENSIADLPIDLPRPDYPVNYLLDGQQRLSTICGAVYWKGDDAGSVWNLAFDLRNECFLHLDSLDEPPLHIIRVNKLADPAVYFKHVSAIEGSSLKDAETLKERSELLFNRVKDYKVAVVTLGDMTIQDVAPIFERINSTGTRLTVVDLMRAATWSPQFDLIDTIDNLLEALQEKNFGGVHQKAVLRNLSAAAGGGFTVESIDTLREYDAHQLEDAASAAEKGYRGAVDFFRKQIGIPTDNLVPYQNQIVALAELFRLIERPSAAAMDELRQWFWRTALSSYFAGWNTGSMAADLRAIRDYADGVTKELGFSCVKPSSDVWIKKSFRANNAQSKAFAILLSYERPVDLISGAHVDLDKALSWGNSNEFHHFFPKAALKRSGHTSSHANALANIICISASSNRKISDKWPSEYLGDVEKAAGGRLKDWLATNLISDAAFEAAKRDDYSEFLNERAKTIHERALTLAGWH